MKAFSKCLAMLVLAACVLCLPFSAAAEASPIDLMPQDEAGYTIVEGDGTVTLDGDTMTIVNNADGDLRIWINYATPFDMTVYNTVVMDMTMDMPFKMAFHLISDADGSDDWLTTSTDYLDEFELDTETDRSPAGDYASLMNIRDLAKDITDKSSVHFDQFIILMTGKGTFTVSRVELTSYEDGEPYYDSSEPTESDTDEPAAPGEGPVADEPAVDADEPAADDATVDAADEGGAFPVVPVAVGAVVLVAAIVVVIVVVKNRKG